MEWTEKQREAIETRDKNILVAAAAGSGKTAVLTERILRHVLDDDDFNLSNLLVVTFTRAAAAEMRQRLEKKINENIAALEKEAAEETGNSAERKLLRLKRQLLLLDSADISTIHSFCQNIIRREGADAEGVVDAHSRIASEEELLLIKQEVIEDIFLNQYELADEYFLRFTRMYGDDSSDVSLYDLVLDLAEFAESEPDPEYWLNSLVADYKCISGELINGGTEDELAEVRVAQWMKYLRKNISRLLAEVRGLVEQCITRAEDFDTEASHKYADFVREEYGAVLNDGYNRLILDIDNQKWDEIRAFVQGINPVVLSKKGTAARAPGFTGDENTDGEVAAIKKLRTKAGEILKKVLQGKLLKKDSAAIVAELAVMGGYVKTLVQLALEFRQRYGKEKTERRIMDFGDLEHLALDIIARRDGKGGYSELTEAGKRIRAHYREIMVDEYQDVNHLQETMFTLLSRSEINGSDDDASLPCRFIVGDVKQSIYRFRHADPNLFNRKKDIYASAGSDGPSCRVDMSDNYRSRSSVLRGINYIFRHFMVGGATEIVYDDREALHFTVDSTADNGFPYSDEAPFLDESVELAIVETDCDEADDTGEAEEYMAASVEKKTDFEYEAEYIAGRIEELLSSGAHIWPDKSDGNHRNIEPKDIVILLRSIGGRAEILREQLKARNIRTYVTVDAGYFDALEVNTVVSLMRIIDNAHQDIPIAAVLRSPIGSFTDDELVRLRLFDRHSRYFYDVLNSADNLTAESEGAELLRAEYLDDDLRLKVRNFLSKLNSWRKAARELSLGELIWQLLRETNYYEYVGAMPGGQLRQANLRLLIDRARVYESEDNRGLFRFLHFIELLKKGKTDLSQARTLGENENVVRIMTIHKSKGMEFPVVILAGMGKKFNTQDENELFIYHKEYGIGGDMIVTARQLTGDSAADDVLRMKQTTIAKEAIKFIINQEMKAEELRLLYVALSRAKEKLIMTGSVKSLEKAVAGWSNAAYGDIGGSNGVDVKPFDENVVMQAKSMLDWVVAAIANHADGGRLHNDDGSFGVCDDGSRFKVDIISLSEKENGSETEKALTTEGNSEELSVSKTEFWSAIKERRQLFNDKELSSEAAELADEVESLLLYEYPDCGTSGLRSKISVTELKHRTQLEEMKALAENEAPLAGGESQSFINQEKEFRLSPLLSGEVEDSADIEGDNSAYIGGALFGTAVHGILQQIVLRNIDCDSAELSKVIEAGIYSTFGKKDKKKLGAYNRKARKYVEGFLRSEMGQRVSAAGRNGKAYCELPFSRLLKIEKAFPDIFKSPKTDLSKLPKIFLQGIIDLLFEENGQLILLDYKTDRNINGAEALARYHRQLELYIEAVEELTGRKIGEAYLFLLDRGESIRFSAQ